MSLKEKLIEVFKKEVSYDCSGHSPEKKCPHCGGIVEKEAYWGYWLDHRSVLSSALFDKLNLPERFLEEFDEWLGEQLVTGDEAKDAKRIVEKILETWTKEEP